jgi:hypothetical protein
MTMSSYPFVKRHPAQITTVLSCCDRVVLTGTLPESAHAGAMERFLRSNTQRC